MRQVDESYKWFIQYVAYLSALSNRVVYSIDFKYDLHKRDELLSRTFWFPTRLKQPNTTHDYNISVQVVNPRCFTPITNKRPEDRRVKKLIFVI